MPIHLVSPLPGSSWKLLVRSRLSGVALSNHPRHVPCSIASRVAKCNRSCSRCRGSAATTTPIPVEDDGLVVPGRNVEKFKRDRRERVRRGSRRVRESIREHAGRVKPRITVATNETGNIVERPTREIAS